MILTPEPPGAYPATLLCWQRRATLAECSTVVLDLYLATITLARQERSIVLQAEGTAHGHGITGMGIVWFPRC